MNTFKPLAGKRIAVLAADGFEQAELKTPLAALADGGADVTLISLRRGRIRAMHMHQPGDLARVDQTIDDAQAADYDGLLIPGGYISPDSLRQSAQVRAFVRQFDTAGKPIALLSQAPLILVSAGLAPRRTLTSWPGIRDDVVNAGATWLNQDVVRDAHVLSCRGTQDLAAFVQALVPFFAGEPATQANSAEAQSDPAQDKPLEQPNQSLRWLAAPSFGTMLSLALLGVGVVAAQRVRHKVPTAEVPADAASARARD
ncbi:type 1 glutamine amidotransferase [Telluria mixta]|uniref:Type 1 glutamine amidotransferase n=1 Tax=Telluria mixta TaxID=34071 RepID=A0ABT2BSP6_9BURK|nr:type 1 glutamine amidotransferase domain-containing protein [Telluria mixta]MCS0628147.1 type 1 glutamine amidotransferase [Telluria mixta]WEM93737.1 type 1 glutamine amidotransferase [Telluria mixta]